MLCSGFRRIGRGIPAGRWNSQGVACKKSNQRGEKQQGSQQCVCLQGLRATARQRMMKKPRVLKRKMFLLIHEPGHYRLTPVSAGTCLKLTQPLNPLATSPPHFISSQFSRGGRGLAQVNLPFPDEPRRVRGLFESRRSSRRRPPETFRFYSPGRRMNEHNERSREGGRTMEMNHAASHGDISQLALQTFARNSKRSRQKLCKLGARKCVQGRRFQCINKDCM